MILPVIALAVVLWVIRPWWACARPAEWPGVLLAALAGRRQRRRLALILRARHYARSERRKAPAYTLHDVVQAVFRALAGACRHQAEVLAGRPPGYPSPARQTALKRLVEAGEYPDLFEIAGSGLEGNRSRIRDISAGHVCSAGATHELNQAVAGVDAAVASVGRTVDDLVQEYAKLAADVARLYSVPPHVFIDGSTTIEDRSRRNELETLPDRVESEIHDKEGRFL